jgi:hypothetical protein
VLLRSTGFRLREEQVPWAMSALVVLALVASPVAWTHYQVLQYPGVALLLIDAWRQRQWVQLIAVLALAALIYPLPIHVMDAFHQAYHDGNSLTSLYIWTSVPPPASLGLFAMFVRRAGKATGSAHPSLLIQAQLHRLPVSRVSSLQNECAWRIEDLADRERQYSATHAESPATGISKAVRKQRDLPLGNHLGLPHALKLTRTRQRSR